MSVRLFYLLLPLMSIAFADQEWMEIQEEAWGGLLPAGHRSSIV